mgnify:FL=1
MAKLETAGYRRFWPLREHMGRTKHADGSRTQESREVYRDMVSGQVHVPESTDGEALGWNGNPPDLPAGSKEREGSERVDRDAYRRNYDLINWHTCPTSGA